MKTLKEIFPSEDIKNISKWRKVGHALGSNPGGVYADENNEKWYVKHSHTEDHAHNEVLANKFYEHLGVPTLEPELVRHGGKLGTASRMKQIQNFNPHNPHDIKKIQKHFAAHAFLSNWDSIGLVDDNQAHTHRGMTTLDAGGALKYRARGEPKGSAFGTDVSEWDTLRHPKNPNAHHVFGNMTPEDLVNSTKPIAKLKNSDIHDIVHTHGGGDYAEKTNLVNKMIGRKKNLIDRANSIAKPNKIPILKDIDE